MTIKMDDRNKSILLKRMRDAVANPPQRVLARDLLSRGLTANEVHQLVVLDHVFDSVPYSFRQAVASAARELANEVVLDRNVKPATRGRFGRV